MIPYKYRLFHRLNSYLWDRYGIPPKLKYFRQRMRRGISDADVWNLDDFMANNIIYGLSYLRDHGQGYNPEILDENGERQNSYENDYMQLGDSYKETREKYHNLGLALWNCTLNDIIEGLQEWKKIRDGWEEAGKFKIYKHDSPEYIEAQRKADKAWKLYVNNIGSFWY